MNAKALECLGDLLEEDAHLVICDEESSLIELIAAKDGDELIDVFPLPMGVLGAAMEVAEKMTLSPTWLDNTTAGRLQVEQFPEEIWNETSEALYGEKLKVTFLGRPGQKYFHFYRAVREEGKGDLGELKRLELTPPELAQVTKWIRVEGLFDRRSGEVIMEILGELSS